MLGQHKHIDMEALAAAQTMAHFDHEAIAPMFECVFAALHSQLSYRCVQV